MSNIPRKSFMPQVNRRSSSASGQDNLPNSQGTRSSSIGCRQSSMGGFRPSICNFKTTDGKTVTPADIAADILKVLEDLDYRLMTVSLKVLQLPSTQLFYSVFEFFLKHIGIEDVWNPEYLATSGSDKKNPASQSQPNAVEKNKLRIELIIFYLEILKFNNVPKPAVLQTMTTPKNWTHMLQIMHFLANDAWFLVCYDADKVVDSFGGGCFNSVKVICDYTKRAFTISCNDPSFVSSDKHRDMRLTFFENYISIIRGELDMDELERNKAEERKKLEYVMQVKRSSEDAINEEKELLGRNKEREKRLTVRNTESDERNKRIKIKKQNQADSKIKLAKMEEKIKVLDDVYDKQVMSGAKMENLQNKHSQKNKELDSTKLIYFDLENKRDNIQMEIMNRTTKVKSIIQQVNEMVTEIKQSSPIEIQDFPSFDILDFHKKNDTIKEYKDELMKIRNKYNEDICKLPEQFAYHREQNKMIDAKIEDGKFEIQQLKIYINEDEQFIKKIKQEGEEFEVATKHKIRIYDEENNDINGDLLQHFQDLESVKDKKKQLQLKKKRIKEEKLEQIKIEQDDYKTTEQSMQEYLENYEKKIVEGMERSTSLLEGFLKRVKEENQRNLVID